MISPPLGSFRIIPFNIEENVMIPHRERPVDQLDHEDQLDHHHRSQGGLNDVIEHLLIVYLCPIGGRWRWYQKMLAHFLLYLCWFLYFYLYLYMRIFPEDWITAHICFSLYFFYLCLYFYFNMYLLSYLYLYMQIQLLLVVRMTLILTLEEFSRGLDYS